MASPETAASEVPANSDLVFLPLGGAGEIGLNAYLYGIGPVDDRKWLLVDCGVSFAGEREPGIDIVLPDLDYLASERRNLLGIVLTHGHEDHYGALAHLWPELQAPVYCTPFTRHLLEGRLIEHGLKTQVPVHEIPVGGRFQIGPFDIELINMTHSIPEPMALAIRTPLGNLLHSGDWKLDETPVLGAPVDQARLQALGEEGCLALMCDSTNVLREGQSISETDVAKSLEAIISRAKYRVAVTTFASNLGRVIAIAKAADAAGRTVIAAGRSIWRMIDAGHEAGYMEGVPPILDIDAFDDLPRANVVCICTGSQGEPRAALSRIAQGTHNRIEFTKGDLVIFSSFNIPGNEKAVASVQNNLSRLGVEIITNNEKLVHSSGHPRRDELAMLYDWLKPKIVVPMHGEPRHLLAQANFAAQQAGAETLIAENGEMVRLAPDGPVIMDEAPSGRLHLDGKIIVPGVHGPANARRKLGYAGMVAVSLVCDKKGRLEDDPKLALFGLPQGEGEFDLEQIIIDAIERAIDAARGEKVELAEIIRRVIRREVDMAWGKKPTVQVFIHTV